MPTIVTTPVQMGSGIADATTVESDLKFLISQTISSTLVCQEAPLALISSSILATALVAANNLSELANKAAARLNLEVHNLYYAAGTTAPATALGNVGDFAFNDNFEWYEKTDSTTWTLRVNAVTAAELTAAIAAHAGATDPHPTYLTQAEAALLYAPLGESPGSGARYNYNVSTTLASTGTGEIRLSTGTLSTVTSIAIHEQDRNSGSMATILDTIGNGSKLQISFDSSEETYAWYNVTAITDNGSYRTYTVTYLAGGTGAIAAGEVTLGIFGAAPVAASGGATGIQYTYSSTAGTPTAGQIRSTNIGVAGAVSISATDAQSQSAADVLARIKVGAIVEIAKDATNRVRGAISADYAVGTNSFDWTPSGVYGTIANADTVYLSIVSDTPSAATAGGHIVQDETTDLTQRSKLAFVGAGVTATDDAAGDRTVVTIPGGGGGGMTVVTESANNATLTSNTIVISDCPTAQILSITGASGIIEIQGKGAGIYSIKDGVFLASDGTSDSGVRRKSTHRYVNTRLIHLGGINWAIASPADMTGIELYAGSVDTRATDYFTAVEATGVTLNATEKAAFSAALNELDSITNWANVVAWYPFIGGTQNACRINAKNPNATTERIIVNSGATFSAAGMTTSFANVRIDTATFLSAALTNTKYTTTLASVTGIPLSNASGSSLFADQNEQYSCVLFPASALTSSDQLSNGSGGISVATTPANPFSGTAIVGGVPGTGAQVRSRLSLAGTFIGVTTDQTRGEISTAGNYYLMNNRFNNYANGVMRNFIMISTTAGLSAAQETALNTLDVNLQTALSR